MMPARYDHLSKEELIQLVESRDRRDSMRFGLVWERDEIERDKALNDDFVALNLVPELCCGDAPWRNLIIEGDNFDALRHLRMCFAGRVKCILIDPPYNTGNRDFLYNDKFVKADDSWRHSTWLEFMYRRLTLARDLLAGDGVIFVHIGEGEVHRLGCLMDQVFPGMKVSTFVWRTRSGSNDSKTYFTSIDHEYILCYANKEFSFAGNAKTFADFGNPDNDPRGPWINDNLVKAHNLKQRPLAFYPIQNPETGVWYACDPDNVWRFASETKLKEGQKIRTKSMEQIIREKKVLWPQDDTPVCYQSEEEIKAAIRAGAAPRALRMGETPEEAAFWDRELAGWLGKPIGFKKPRYKRHRSEVKRAEKPLSTWILPAAMKPKERGELDLEGIETLETGYTSDGTSMLQEILGHKDFPYPKPLAVAQALITQVTGPDDIVCDFFAGSGTTGHAVLARNAEDGGDRRFILVSNSESTPDEPEKNICRDITRQRLRKVIEGYEVPGGKKAPKSVEGLGGDFAYLRAQRLPAGELMDLDHKQVWLSLQLMHTETVAPFSAGPFQWSGNEDQAVMYIPRFNKNEASIIRGKIGVSARVLVYSWQPEAVRQAVRVAEAQYLPVPETLARKFGMKV